MKRTCIICILGLLAGCQSNKRLEIFLTAATNSAAQANEVVFHATITNLSGAADCLPYYGSYSADRFVIVGADGGAAEYAPLVFYSAGSPKDFLVPPNGSRQLTFQAYITNGTLQTLFGTWTGAFLVFEDSAMRLPKSPVVRVALAWCGTCTTNSNSEAELESSVCITSNWVTIMLK
jgi:hypothetical protein